LTNFQEIHGDRLFGDDPAIVAGTGQLDGRPVMVIGEQKGRDTKEKLYRNFGMPKPEGYRKALRAMHLASKFGRPIVTFLDTPGAYPGIDAEERGRRRRSPAIYGRCRADGTGGRDLHRRGRVGAGLGC
jgi:acetyl-CoA carboxylase carboxyl transferase subunit alpha